MLLRRLTVSRRMTLASAPLLAITACRWGPEDSDDAGQPAGPPAPPDEEQVTAAIAAIRTAQALVAALEVAHPGLAGALAPLLDLHAEHLELLDATPTVFPPSQAPQPGATPPSGAGSPPASGESNPTLPQVPPSAPAAWRQLVQAEHSLESDLARLAGEVTSGPLARVLAAMAAGVAQNVAALPPAPRDET